MSATSPAFSRTRADVLSTLTHRYREEYGDQLVSLYATRRDPYHPSQDEGEEGVHVTVVLKGPYESWNETDTITEIAYDVMDESEWAIPLVPHHIAQDSTVARWVEEEGVRLD